MQLIGYMDSPFVRRVAVSAQVLGLPYEHRELSIFRDFEKFRELNPLVKVPTLICDDGQALVDSTLIIDHLEFVAGKSLLPSEENDRVKALKLIGTALVAMEKVVQIIYETRQRPEEIQHQPWIARILTQLRGALGILELAAGDGAHWLVGDKLTQADISVAIAWRFTRHIVPDSSSESEYAGLVALSERAESLPEFKACSFA